jgi:hypothetical protein
MILFIFMKPFEILQMEKIKEKKENGMSDADRVKALRNALDDIVELCDTDRVRPKMKLALIETFARLARGLTNDENNVYE